ncbi:MAG TPA: hypothetical protein VFN51_03320 [Candidatus Saccharimonadales bacterium]|nr:hypothetical protein [Candidatus Saccharimonadales bacterium]
MRFRRGIAIATSTLAFGSFGMEVTEHNMASAAAAANTAEYCEKAYDYGGLVLNSLTVKCMEAEKVPDGQSIPRNYFQPGWPVGLLNNYVQLERYKAKHFDPGLMILMTIGGTVFGSVIPVGEGPDGGNGGDGFDDGPPEDDGGDFPCGNEGLQPLEQTAHEYKLSA